MDRQRVAALLAVALLAAVPVAPVAAAGPALATDAAVAAAASPPAVDAASVGARHGFHVSVGPQATTDGTVIAEVVGVLAPSFLAVRVDGAVVGVTFIERVGERTDVAVPVDAGAWDDWTGNRTVEAVLYRDDGDGVFDPDADPSMADRYPSARSTATVGRSADGAARVLASDSDPLTVANGTVTVRRVELPDAGHVVVRPFAGGDPLGSRRLAAGTHRNVSVGVNRSAVTDRTGAVSVRIALYRDDGDGSFAGDERPVTVGEETVGTVTRLTADPSGGVSIVTAADDTDSPPDDAADATAASGTVPPSDSTASTGPGFTVVAVIAALLAAAALSRRPE